ncbi:MAG: hypothetical protein ABFD00_10605 [Chloroherpetonaceae bacterium]
MVQYIKPASIFGRLGTGIGQGITESAPKEIERGRLAQGLQQLSQQRGLTPFQQYAGLASLPGVTPQILQGGSELLRQQAYLNALRNQYAAQNPVENQNKEYFQNQQNLNEPPKGEIPTLGTPEATEQSYKNFIPPTEEQERANANENLQRNPYRYNHNFDKALEEQKAITARNKEIQQAYRNQENIATEKEGKIKKAFDEEALRLGINPRTENANFNPKMYQKFENKLLNSILPKSKGGEGLTQEQAIKKYSDKLFDSFRNYQDLQSLSAWSPIDFNTRLNSIQKEFKKEGNQQILMDELVSKYKLPPMYAAHRAYPIKKENFPTLEKVKLKSGSGRFGVSLPPMNDAIYSQLKKEMGKTNSPLSIAWELHQRKQNPRGWINYLINNKDNLEDWQKGELSKPINLIDLKELWLNAWE